MFPAQNDSIEKKYSFNRPVFQQNQENQAKWYKMAGSLLNFNEECIGKSALCLQARCAGTNSMTSTVTLHQANDEFLLEIFTESLPLGLLFRIFIGKPCPE
jgi:hypothetical protein